LAGQSFASRIAASLLNAIDLPELVTASQADYEALAINLASNPDKINLIKTKIARNRLATPLFDTPLFTKKIEEAYKIMHQKFHSGLTPEHLHIY
jgi:predicted O-linked N-acetylglucosamine transferase (SPINDLY family)